MFDTPSPDYCTLIGHLIAGRTIDEVPTDIQMRVASEGYDLDAIVARYAN